MHLFMSLTISHSNIFLRHRIIFLLKGLDPKNLRAITFAMFILSTKLSNYR